MDRRVPTEAAPAGITADLPMQYLVDTRKERLCQRMRGVIGRPRQPGG